MSAVVAVPCRHPSRPQFLHDQRQRQAPPPQSRGQQPPQPHTFHPHGPGGPDVRGQRPPLAGGGWAGRAPPGGAGDAAAAAQLPVQGGRDPGAARHSGGATGGGTPAPQPLGGDGATPACVTSASSAAFLFKRMHVATGGTAYARVGLGECVWP